MNVIDAMTDPQLFGPHFAAPSWANWRAVLKGAFHGELSEAEADIFRRATKRETTPEALRELWIVAGRRAGKDSVASFLAVSLACGRDWKKELRAGETVVGMVICPDRRQGRVALNYMKGYLETIPLLGEMVEEIQKEAIVFRNGIQVAIHTASFRSVRGYTVPFAILDELAFFRDESSAVPDSEILQALKPAMGTVPDSLLICISTPYARRGELWKAHQRHYGKEDPNVLVVAGPTRAFNPTIPDHVIAEAFQEDAIAAASEYGSLEDGITFRSDVETFIPREAVEAVVIKDRRELPYVRSLSYRAFIDPSGGSSDSMTLGIAHEQRDGDGKKSTIVLDLIRERRPPFSPEGVAMEFAETLKSYGLSTATSDRYGGQWVVEMFGKYGIRIEPSERSKSEIYLELLPKVNSKQVELLDDRRLVSQLLNLERRTSRSAKDSVDHGPSQHDDLINAAAGALVSASGGGGNKLIVIDSLGIW
jgi:hypothetical protein